MSRVGDAEVSADLAAETFAAALRGSAGSELGADPLPRGAVTGTLPSRVVSSRWRPRREAHSGIQALRGLTP